MSESVTIDKANVPCPKIFIIPPVSLPPTPGSETSSGPIFSTKAIALLFLAISYNCLEPALCTVATGASNIAKLILSLKKTRLLHKAAIICEVP